MRGAAFAGMKQNGKKFVSMAESGTIGILHVITHLSMGGAENVALQLISGLTGEFRFALFAVQGEGPDGPIGQDMLESCNRVGCPVFWGTRHGFKSGGALQAAWRLIRVLERERPAIIHLHCEIAELVFALATLLRPSLRHRAVLRTVHNCTLWIKWEALGRLVTQRLAFTDAVAVSRAAALADSLLLGPDHRRVLPEVIYNSAYADLASERADDGSFKVLFAGRFVYQKGADLIAPLLHEAAKQCTGRLVEVTLAGHGEARDAIAAGVADLPPGWTVRFLAPIARLAERLGEYDAVLMPSRFEGFSLLALETLMAGIPLITARAPGLDEALPEDYPLAATVEDSEAMGAMLAAVIADPGFYRDFLKAMRPSLVERFSAQSTLSAYAARYRNLAATLG